MSDLAHPAIHRQRIDPSRSMKDVTAEVAELLDGVDEERRRSSALLASELIAQVAGSSSSWNLQPIGLTIQLGEGSIRFEAVGPVPPGIDGAAGDKVATDDPIADWGPYLIDRLADRWGLGVGTQRAIWAEISTSA
jgi:hypothetical protein